MLFEKLQKAREDKDAKAIPRFPNIDTQACVANLLDVDSSSFRGTKIIEPGYTLTSLFGCDSKIFRLFSYRTDSPFG